MKKKVVKTLKATHAYAPFLKRFLYTSLFIPLSLELLNIYSLYFSPEPQQVVSAPPLTEEEPAEFTQSEDDVTSTPTDKVSPGPTEEWGKARQLDEHTWTIKVGEDKHMGTPEEILKALNEYRQRHGSPTLQWDDKLAEYAKTRSDHFEKIKATDKHVGFGNFVNNENGFEKLGFNALGENSSYGFHVEAVHLIEWVCAGDEPHNKNQLNPEWSHVGIGVSGTGTNLIFGGKKR